MKKTSELLQILLALTNLIGNGGSKCGGLCALTTFAYIKDLITYQEKREVEDYIKSFEHLKQWGNYYWPKGEREPRVKWLKQQITILKEKENENNI